MRKIITVILMLFFLSACKIDIVGMIERIETFKVHVYETGRPVKEYEIAKGDEKYIKLLQWAKDNRTGWQMTPATYVPGILVSSDGMSINFLGSGVIFNGPEGQYSRDINPADYSFLK